MATTSNTPILLSRAAQEGLLLFSTQCYNMMNQQWNIREQMLKIDLAYQREVDNTNENVRAKIANRYGDSRRYQDIVVPVVMPQVENAVMYQTSVFLQGNPIFGVVASPQYQDAAMQMESIIDENATRGAWTRELMLFFRNGAKYNIAALEVSWCRKTLAALETNTAFSATQGKPKEVIWEGNRVKNMDMYNTFYDTRVSPADMHKRGEFAGYTELLTRIELKSLINDLPDKMVDNIKAAFESGIGAQAGGGITGGIESFYIPQVNSEALVGKNPRASTDWMAWAGIGLASGSGAKINYRNLYEVTTLYGKIIPSDFGIRVPSANTPQIWKLIIVNHSVIIYSERQTNVHGYLPMLFSQPLEDGLFYQTKSLAQNVEPMQAVSTALMSSSIAARRRAISDRGLYDPSRVTEANINADNPSAKIPVRPAAYGKPLSEAYYPIPFRDDQSPIVMQELQQIAQFTNTITGHNQAQQGQFVKGNKTKHEFDTIMGNASGRDQMVSMMIEAQTFVPLKEILKLNILQYQGAASIFNRSKNIDVSIDPTILRKAVLEFKVSDGLLPSDKLISADAFQTSIQVIGSSPQIGAGYNLAPMFSYLMKTQGADLSEFEKSPQQVAYEQAVGQWQQLVLQMQKQNPALTPDKYPPQPQPQQFGYVPGAPIQPQQSQSQQ